MKEYQNFSEMGVPKNYKFTKVDLFDRFTQFPPEEFAPYVQISNKGIMKDDISATSKFSLCQNERTIVIAAYSCLIVFKRFCTKKHSRSSKNEIL